MVAPVILVEAQPALVATGAPVTVRLAGGGGTRPFDYSGHSDWRAGIRGLPTMIASLEYEGGEFPAGSVPSAAAIEWQGSSRALLATLSSYLWTDAAITVRVGPEGTLPSVLISGKVLAATAEAGKLTLALADPAASLKKPLLTARFAGTGGLEGPVEWAGLIRKRVWGRIWNLAGEPIDKANNIYCFADPLRPIQAFDAVRDKGANAAALTLLAWQGSAAATFAALQTAIAPAGGGVVCPSIACVKWWTQPAGELCADLRGEVGAGYVETTAAIAQRLVEAIGGPAFVAGTVAAAITARPAAVGWLADDDSTTVAAMLDELLGNSSLLWLLDDAGAIELRPWAWGAPVASAKSEDVTRKEVLRPLATRRLGYKRNETQMARGDLAAIVLSSDVNYLDGTPIEALKPAQLGSDKTSTNTAAAIAGQAWAATNGSLAAAANAYAAFGAGQNRCRFSMFEKGNTGWANRFNPSGLSVTQTAFSNNGLRIGKLEWTFGAAGQTVSIGTATGERYRIPVKQGEFIYCSVGLRGQGPLSGGFPSLIFTSSADVYVSSWNLPTNTGELLGGILARWEGLVQVPAGVSFAYLEAYVTSSGAGAASIEISQPMIVGAIAGQVSFPAFSPGPSAEYGSDITGENVASAITGQGALATKNVINPTTGDLSALGSIPPSVPDNSFSYTSTISSVTISWPSLTIYRADGSTVAVSSGSVTINSLSSSTTFRVYPYVVDSGGSSGSISFVSGGAEGSPAYCFYLPGSALAASQMNARGNIPMGAFNVATTSGGSGGGGGGGSNCLHPDTFVGGKRAGDLQVGDAVETPTGLAQVRFINRQPCSEWFAIYSGEAELARVTRNHLFYLAATKGAVRADGVRLGDLLASASDHVEVTGIRLINEPADLVGIEIDAPHLHFVGPLDLLTHNGLNKP